LSDATTRASKRWKKVDIVGIGGKSTANENKSKACRLLAFMLADCLLELEKQH